MAAAADALRGQQVTLQHAPTNSALPRAREVFTVRCMEQCVFCRSETTEFASVGAAGAACARCIARLGMMLKDAEPILFTIFPALRDVEDEDEPEPTVRLPDGRRVELRERTAELKKDLTIDQRAELTSTYVEIGLHREAVLEAGVVLSSGVLSAAGRVLPVLFSAPLSAPDALERIRPLLLPV